MRKSILWLFAALSLTACAEYPGRQTNCWSDGGASQPSVSRNAQYPVLAFTPTQPNEECVFVPLG